MKIDAAKTAALLKAQDHILILTHAHPDGDTLGCGYALCRALQRLGKQARVENEKEIPKKYAYLWDGVESPAFEPDYIVSVDVAELHLLGALKDRYADRIDLSIDHHGSNPMFAAANFLESEAAATAELVYQVILALGVELDTGMADCIYTGLSTDTGCFRYANTTSDTFRTAAAMLDAGANVPEINRVMFEMKTRTYAALERLALDSMEFYLDGKLAIMYVTQEMFRISGSNEGECEAIAALPRQVEGVVVGVTLKEREVGYKASVRTYEPVDASKLCRKMRGGGHARAAGCAFDGTMEEAKQEIIQNVKEALGK